MLQLFLKAQLSVNLHLTSGFLIFMGFHRDWTVFSWGCLIFPILVRVTRLLRAVSQENWFVWNHVFFWRSILCISSQCCIGTGVVFVPPGQQRWLVLTSAREISRCLLPHRAEHCHSEPSCYQCFPQTLTSTHSQQKLLLYPKLIHAWSS